MFFLIYKLISKCSHNLFVRTAVCSRTKSQGCIQFRYMLNADFAGEVELLQIGWIVLLD